MLHCNVALCLQRFINDILWHVHVSTYPSAVQEVATIAAGDEMQGKLAASRSDVDPFSGSIKDSRALIQSN